MPKEGGVGHVLTLTGLNWDDSAGARPGDNVLQDGEGAIFYLDPNGDPVEQYARITLGMDGRLEFLFDNATWYIDGAFTESVPSRVPWAF